MPQRRSRWRLYSPGSTDRYGRFRFSMALEGPEKDAPWDSALPGCRSSSSFQKTKAGRCTSDTQIRRHHFDIHSRHESCGELLQPIVARPNRPNPSVNRDSNKRGLWRKRNRERNGPSGASGERRVGTKNDFWGDPGPVLRTHQDTRTDWRDEKIPLIPYPGGVTGLGRLSLGIGKRLHMLRKNAGRRKKLPTEHRALSAKSLRR